MTGGRASIHKSKPACASHPDRRKRRFPMNKQEVIDELNKCLQYEIAVMIRYLHHSFLIFGTQRLQLVPLIRQSVQDGILHATLLGDKITALGGYPELTISETFTPGGKTVEDVLKEDLKNEVKALEEYKKLLKLVRDDVAMDEMIRNIIGEEQQHVEELEKLLRDK